MKYLKNIGKFILYGGYQAYYLYRFSSFLYKKNLKILSKLVHRVSMIINNIDIDPRAKLSNSVSFTHPLGVVIGGGCIIGENVIIRQNVTLGQKGNSSHATLDSSIHPIIGNNVSIGAGACILGGIKIGDNSVIGANSVVLTDVPPNSVAVGIPAKIIYNGDKID